MGSAIPRIGEHSPYVGEYVISADGRRANRKVPRNGVLGGEASVIQPVPNNRRIPKVLINAQTGQRGSSQKQMSGYATYQELGHPGMADCYQGGHV
jgi:hypothetical protein